MYRDDNEVLMRAPVVLLLLLSACLTTDTTVSEIDAAECGEGDFLRVEDGKLVCASVADVVDEVVTPTLGTYMTESEINTWLTDNGFLKSDALAAYTPTIGLSAWLDTDGWASDTDVDAALNDYTPTDSLAAWLDAEGWASDTDVDAAIAAALTAYATTTWVESTYATQSTTDALDAWLTTVDDRVADIEADYALGSEVAARLILDDLTIDVSQSGTADHEFLDQALAALDGAWISPAATVTIQVADGLYDHRTRGSITIRHPCADRIEIIGNAASPSSVELDFAGHGGLQVSGGVALGRLAGIRISGDGSGVGLLVTEGSFARVESTVQIRDFEDGLVTNLGSGVLVVGGSTTEQPAISADNDRYGIFAVNGSVVVAEDGVRTRDNGDDGMRSHNGSFMKLDYGASDGNEGDGFVATALSGIVASNGTAGRSSAGGADNRNGLRVGDMAYLDGGSMQISYARNDGASVFNGSVLTAGGIHIDDSTRNGVDVEDASYAVITGAEIDTQGGSGIRVSDFSAVVARGSYVANSGEFGLDLNHMSYTDWSNSVPWLNNDQNTDNTGDNDPSASQNQWLRNDL
jgi:hypothetical protein